MPPSSKTAPSASPAMTTIRGFAISRVASPLASGDDDSDNCSAPNSGSQPALRLGTRRAPRIVDVVSANCSPSLRATGSPGISGITKMRMEMEHLSLSSSRTSTLTMSRSGSQAGLTSTSRSDSRGSAVDRSDDDVSLNGSTEYELPLEDEFVSEIIDDKPKHDAVEGGPKPRKIQAVDFDVICRLGTGTYGVVDLVKHRSTGRLYAQKQFKKASVVVHKKLVEQTKMERQILESVNRHPFVVKLFFAFQDHAKLYLILEYGQGGELFTHLNTEKMFSETVAAFYMAEMLLALYFLHDTLGVIYRDLKPENCLLDARGHLLLTDFGLSKVPVDDKDECKSILGTLEYMAPEVVLGKPYNKAVDWWSLGAIGYDLMTGSPPFRGANHAKIQHNILNAKPVMPYFLSAEAKDLLARFLRKDPAKRLGANMPKDILTMKKHRFFRKLDWKKLEAREVDPPIKPLITNPELAENFSPEFTGMCVSPVLTARDPWEMPSLDAEDKLDKDNPFGGFSYVASSSLLEDSRFGCA